jgi:ankyrin repeat protein
VRTLLAADPNAVNVQRRTPLHAAAELEDPKLAEDLLQHGDNAVATDVAGCSPLKTALQLGHDSVALAFMKSGVPIRLDELKP